MEKLLIKNFRDLHGNIINQRKRDFVIKMKSLFHFFKRFFKVLYLIGRSNHVILYVVIKCKKIMIDEHKLRSVRWENISEQMVFVGKQMWI